MSKIAIGKAVPDIELPATGDKKIKLSDYRGKPVILYFYPKASTPGCGSVTWALAGASKPRHNTATRSARENRLINDILQPFR